MKTVYMVRHAKSAWDNPDIPDHFRKLTPQGEEDIRKVAKHLRMKFVNPELIITSSATRALETAKIMAEELHYPLDQININSSFYRAEKEEIMETLFYLPDEVESVMIVGHNPTFTNLVNSFLENEDKISKLSTSSVAAFRFKSEHWEELEMFKHHLEFIITPKEL
ncbi:MAG: histidine phosphatase family protein [Bacteroidales bacterium]|nr:histidine phosphatase family protein [Bacteroidales bacterium]